MGHDKQILYEEKEECCACGACVNICAKGAIKMIEDEAGFLYPEIDEQLCVSCGLCKKVCNFQKSTPIESRKVTYVAVSKNKKLLKKSASGGIFAAIAEKILGEDGIVVGACLGKDFRVRHILINKLDELESIQGSKYVQSEMGYVYRDVKKYLNQGRRVLFSGTPCQVDGLKGFLGKDYANLITIDIVCHGVPNNRMFKEYILSLERKYHSPINEFVFRDKSIGWGINGSVLIGNKKKKIWGSASTYLFYFSKGWIYRRSCYECKYASSSRPADFTIGDYWGIEKQHPEYLEKDGLNERWGLSLLIANNEKAIKLLESYSDIIELKESTFEKATAKNAQLCYPSQIGNSNKIIDLYQKSGWEGLERRFEKNIGWRRYKSQIKNIIPIKIKKILKRIMG